MGIINIREHKRITLVVQLYLLTAGTQLWPDTGPWSVTHKSTSDSALALTPQRERGCVRQGS